MSIVGINIVYRLVSEKKLRKLLDKNDDAEPSVKIFLWKGYCNKRYKLEPPTLCLTSIVKYISNYMSLLMFMCISGNIYCMHVIYYLFNILILWCLNMIGLESRWIHVPDPTPI